MTGDLVERLRARLADLEAIATAAPDCLNHAEWPFWIDVDNQSDYDATNAWRDAIGPAHVLRTIQAHRKIIERYEATVVARDVAVGTPLAGATRMVLRIEREHLELLASIYFPESDGESP